MQSGVFVLEEFNIDMILVNNLTVYFIILQINCKYRPFILYQKAMNSNKSCQNLLDNLPQNL